MESFDGSVTIKEETDLTTVETTALIKYEHEDVANNDHVNVPTDFQPKVEESAFQNIQIEVKEEVPEDNVQDKSDAEYVTSVDYQNEDNTPKDSAHKDTLEYLRVEIKKEFDAYYQHSTIENKKKHDTEDCTEIEPQAEVKEEIQMDGNVSDDLPNFDSSSMHSDDGMSALANVEACLDEGVEVKRETETEHQILEQIKQEFAPADIKLESGLTVTDTHLVPTCSSTIQDNTQLKNSLVIKIGKNKNGVPEIILNPNGLPDKFENCEDPYLVEGHEEIVNSEEAFQLNSITGDVLTLEQQAFGVQDPTPSHCHLCPKKFRTKYSLKTHLAIHAQIVKNNQSRIIGITKKKATIAKKRRLKEQKLARDYAQYLADIVKGPRQSRSDGQKYKCTCGKVYQRRTRMETCLRAHDFFQMNCRTVPCLSCHKSFKSKHDLDMHRKRIHKKKFPCKFCPTDYNSRSELFKHLKIHQKVQLLEYKVFSEVVQEKQDLKCVLCSNTFTELSELKLHAMLDHQAPYTCPHCKNKIATIAELVTHTDKYHPDVGSHIVLNVVEAFSRLVKQWKCEDCNIQFYDTDKLALHQAEKHSMITDTEAQCEYCRRIFLSQKALTSHQRVHHNSLTTEENKELVNGIMCLECRKMCKDINALTSHMRLHSPDRKFPCKFCDFRFATKEKRKAHAEIHTGDMKYVCFICEYQCSSESRLKSHKRSPRHFNMRNYLLTGKPLLVQESTCNKNDVESHKEKRRPLGDTGDKAKSPKKRKENETCNKEQTSSSSSEEDGNSDRESVACDICGDEFSSYRNMQLHKQDHPFIEILAEGQDKPERIFFK